jgi:hypothetical protein
MRKLLCLLLCAFAFAQDPGGGRDTGEGRAIHFVRWQRSVEAGEIYLAAWRALEPHLVELGRRRLVDFDGDPARARAYFAAAKEVALVVAFGEEAAAAARAALPKTPVVHVSTAEDADVVLRVDRERLAALVRLFHPRARQVALFGPADETLKDLKTKRCATAADAKDTDVAWVAEGGALPDGVQPAVISTAPDVPGALTVRPDPQGAGLKTAAAVVARLRDGRDPGPRHVARLHLTVDLAAARAAGHEVPLPLLARADAVKGAP